MGNPWDNDPIVGAPPKGPVYGAPPVVDPYKARDQQLQEAGAAREAQKFDYQRGHDAQQFGNQGIDNTANARKEYNALSETKNYSEALSSLTKAFRAPDTAQGDLGVIYSFAKIMDPGSVVREGEMDMANSTSSLVQDLYRRFGRITDSNRLPPEVRKGLIEEARQAAGSLNQVYTERRNHYRQIAQSMGVDPSLIVGDHLGDTYKANEEAYLGRPVHEPNQVAPVKPPLDPDGTGDIGFNQEAQRNPLKPEQQAAYDAWWAVNPNPSPDQLRAFGTSMGVGIDNAEAIIDARKKGAGVQRASTAVYTPHIENTRKGDEIVDPIMRGVADTATLGLSEELAAGVDTLANGQDYGQNLANENAIRDYDKENNFGLRLAGQFAGGAVLPTGGASGVKGLAKVGAAYGGAYGAGSTDGSAGDRALGALTGAAGGAATGGLLGALSPALPKGAAAVGRRVAGPSSPEQQAILRAGTEEGVPVNMTDIYPETRNAAATLETIPGASGQIRGGIEAGRDAMKGRVAALGRGGSALEDNVGGQAVQRTADTYIKGSGARLGKQYDALEKAAGGVKVPPKQALAVVDSVIGKLSETAVTNKAEIAFLKGLKQDFSKDLSVGALRKMRTTLRKKISKGELTFGEDEATVLSIMDAASGDIATGLAAAGKKSVAAQFAKVDGQYRDRMEFIRGTVQKLVGKRGANLPPGQVFANLKAMTSPKGDDAGFARLLGEMDPADHADIAATFADALGKNNKGEFSISHFVTQAEKFPKAQRTHLFGADGAKSIENLITLGKAKEGTINRLNNSRSGQVSNYRTVLSSVLLGIPGGGAVLGMAAGLNGATGAVGGAAIAGTGIAVSRQIAKALMNEEFTRILAQAPGSTSPAAINNHIGRLRALGAKDPNVRAVVESLEKRLLQTANDNFSTTSQSAASNGSESERR